MVKIVKLLDGIAELKIREYLTNGGDGRHRAILSFIQPFGYTTHTGVPVNLAYLGCFLKDKNIPTKEKVVQAAQYKILDDVMFLVFKGMKEGGQNYTDCAIHARINGYLNKDGSEISTTDISKFMRDRGYRIHKQKSKVIKAKQMTLESTTFESKKEELQSQVVTEKMVPISKIQAIFNLQGSDTFIVQTIKSMLSDFAMHNNPV